MNANQQHTPATGQEIQEILGPAAEETIINDILQTGASRQEVLEAFEWLHDDDYMGADLERPMDARSRMVYDILQSDRDRYDRE